MDCQEARRLLWPAEVLRVSDEDVEAALEHARECPDCEVFLEEDRQIARLIGESCPKICAPRELRERLYTALARERAGSTRAREPAQRSGRALAAALLTILGLALGAGGYWLVGRGQTASAATAFAEDYLRRVVEQEELNTGDSDEIASFFARKLGVAMPPPEVPGFKVRRAAICLMNGRRGGVVEYENRGRQLTYYLVPSNQEGLAGSARLTAARAARATISAPALATEQGLGVATWWDGNHQHALVGNLPRQELRNLAPLFTCPGSRL